MTKTQNNTEFKLTWKINLIAIWLIIALFSLISLAYYIWKCNNYEMTYLKDIILIGIAGGLGGTVYCMRGFYQKIGKKEFDTTWVWWYIFRPIISIVVGAFSYFFISGGILVLGKSQNLEQTNGLMFFASLSFIIGITFSRFMDKIYQIAEALFSSKNNKEKENG